MNKFFHLTDNDTQGTLIPKECIQDILQISSIGSLQNAPDLLVFPHSFTEAKDCIGDLSIVTLHDVQYADGRCVSAKVRTGNLMGFVGVNETSLSIHSRFTHKKENGVIDSSSQDHFLYYMLQKVFSINVFSLDHASSREDQQLDFLLFLFPLMLKKAMSQGLYKEYRRILHDDDRVKGAIDINRFIRNDIPFKGNISYTTREYSYDNTITQLIRHTIEYIKHHTFGNAILSSDSDITEYVRQIVEATPSYHLRDRQRVLSANLRPKVHPYFTNYRELQQLCLHILRHESLKYGEDKDRIHGVLFDGAWLWEEYLDKILGKADFKHPRNKDGTDHISLFTDGSGWRYPDFYHLKKEVVLDAKYKRMEKFSGVSDVDRDDVHQVIAYMHVLKSRYGGLVFPSQHSAKTCQSLLYGFGGAMQLLPVHIPQANTWEDFTTRIKQSETNLLSQIEGMVM